MRYDIVRATEKETGRPISVLADLQDPKSRIGRMACGPIELAPGDTPGAGTYLVRIARVPLQQPAG